MTTLTRVAGWGRRADGASVTWTVAEGRRGRRWREVVSTGDAVHHALLLETSPDGRFSHLELARAGGLWTFHPEGDGTLHGNAVERDRPEVLHVAGWAFAPEDMMLVEGSPLSAAAIAWHAATSGNGALSTGSAGPVAGRAGVVLRVDGTIEAVEKIRLEKLGDGRWHVGDEPSIAIDDAGLPLLSGGVIRPLELE
jgi:hypothetical protein